ncbi:MAG: hypothetical protein BAJALOKI1v1_820018 [Promethearchaeota archaeon]|nr:MAG: hypothetical protein BAJALOKI1v1_820018 [Candidatus Lokiarchaeota archaeon]
MNYLLQLKKFINLQYALKSIYILPYQVINCGTYFNNGGIRNCNSCENIRNS